MMTCEDFERELGEAELSADAQTHLAHCEACGAAAQVVALAQLPDVTGAERAALAGLPAAVHAAWRRGQRRRSTATRVLGWAAAAGIGALIATGVMWKLQAREPASPRVTRSMAPPDFAIDPAVFEAPVLPDVSGEADALNQNEDEVFFDVSWPSVTEGEL